MSDFLSKFSNDHYNKTNQNSDCKIANKSTEDSAHELPRRSNKKRMTSKELQNLSDSLQTESSFHSLEDTSHSASNQVDDQEGLLNQTESQTVTMADDIKEKLQAERTTRKSSFEVEPEVEIDQTYQRKKRNKRMIIGIVAVISLLLIGIVMYVMMHVTVPDFTNQAIADVKKWGKDHKITIVMEQEYHSKVEPGFVIKQSVPFGKRIRKNSDLIITASKGADPEETITLPDFNELSFQEAKDWIQQHQAENLKITKKYSDDIEENKFISIEFKDKNEVNASNYKRKDKATIMYSKGKETYEKNIEVPDFKEKAKLEVEAWAKKNEIAVTFTEEASKTIPNGMIITQSVAAGEKLAKKDEMAVVVSTGEEIIVPNYYNLTQEEASNVKGMNPIIKQRYNTKVPYGQLISQSLASGVALGEKDDKTITLVYSLGTPYLSDLRGTNESELQKFIYDTFTSKGVTVTYSTYYIDSDQAKGTIVEQSTFGSYMGLSFTVSFGISNGSGYQFNPTPSPEPSANSQDTPLSEN